MQMFLSVRKLIVWSATPLVEYCFSILPHSLVIWLKTLLIPVGFYAFYWQAGLLPAPFSKATRLGIPKIFKVLAISLWLSTSTSQNFHWLNSASRVGKIGLITAQSGHQSALKNKTTWSCSIYLPKSMMLISGKLSIQLHPISATSLP